MVLIIQVQNHLNHIHINELSYGGCVWLLVGLHPMTLLTGGNTSVECPPLKCPDHGFVNIVNNSASVTEAVYSCEESFVPRGDYKRYCQRNGQWTGSDPHCSVAIGEGLKGWSVVMRGSVVGGAWW